MQTKYWLGIIASGFILVRANKALNEQNKLQQTKKNLEIELSSTKKEISKYQKENELLKKENQNYKNELQNKIENYYNNPKKDTNKILEKYSILDNILLDTESEFVPELKGLEGYLKLKNIMNYKKPQRKIKKEKPAIEEKNGWINYNSSSIDGIWIGSKKVK